MNQLDIERPSRASVSWTYLKRVWNWKKNSSPFLSGDLFSDNADVSVFPPKFRGKHPNISQIKNAKVIFCPSDKLVEFFEDYGSNISARVVICGNSDKEFHELPERFPNSIRQFFLQNSFISDSPLVTTLPIGVENLRWGTNGFPQYLVSKQTNFENEIVIGPFGTTHHLRKQVCEEYRNHRYKDIILLENRLSPKNYWTKTSNYKFVAAVRGNGVDTHRVWESLYRGLHPIVQEDRWSISLRELNLPLVFTQDWHYPSLSGILQSNICENFFPDKLPALWWPYWKNLIKKYV